MKKSERHQLSAVIHHFLYRTYELPLSWYGMTVPGLSQADITCLHGTCRTVLFAADRLMIAGDLPVLDARPFNDRVVHKICFGKHKNQRQKKIMYRNIWNSQNQS